MGNALDLIIERQSEQNIFRSYKDSKQIAAEIYQSFKKFYSFDNQGFPLDGGTDKIGIISNCMALSTFIELKKMGAFYEQKKNNIDTSEDDAIFYNLIQKVFEEIYLDGREAIFNATPYISDEYRITNYIETISKVLITMVDLREYFINKSIVNDIDNYVIKNKINIRGTIYNNFDGLIEEVEHLIGICIKKLNEGCLPIQEDYYFQFNNQKLIDEKIEYKGWNFQIPTIEEMNQFEPSIYYTYHATNAYLNFYNSFTLILDQEFKHINYSLDRSDEKYTFKEKKLSLDQDFFNRHLEDIKSFRTRTISAGRYFDMIMRKNGVDLAFDFVNNDLKPESINFSFEYETNILLNTTFVLAILINADVDGTYNQLGEKDYFYGQLQHALSNVKKVYDSAKRASKDDFVNSYHFANEHVSEQEKAVFQTLRMSYRGSLYDFIPLYCNTYNTIFDFLIQYPQKEMSNNVALILENKAENEWYWNRKAFDANNNIYYLFALENFYIYYQNYEANYVDTDRSLQILKQEYKKEKDLINNRHINELEKLQEELAYTKKLYDEKNSKLDAEVISLAERAVARSSDLVKEAVYKLVRTYLKDIINQGKKFSLEMLVDSKQGKKMYESNEDLQILYQLAWSPFATRSLNKDEFNGSTDDEAYQLGRITKTMTDNILDNLKNQK